MGTAQERQLKAHDQTESLCGLQASRCATVAAWNASRHTSCHARVRRGGRRKEVKGWDGGGQLLPVPNPHSLTVAVVRFNIFRDLGSRMDRERFSPSCSTTPVPAPITRSDHSIRSLDPITRPDHPIRSLGPISIVGFRRGRWVNRALFCCFQLARGFLEQMPTFSDIDQGDDRRHRDS